MKRFNVSQNVATVGLRGLSPEKQNAILFQQWYQQEKLFEPNKTDMLFGEEHANVKDFINVIWADSYLIGCSRVIFHNDIPNYKAAHEKTIWTIERLVCNYGPAENSPGSSIYKRGIPCSDCPEGFKCGIEYPSLCSYHDYAGGRERSTKANVEDRSGFHQKSKSVTTTQETKEGTTKDEVVFQKINTVSVSTNVYNKQLDDNKSESLILKAGIYFKGVCHCPDIIRYGFSAMQKGSLNLKKSNRITTTPDWSPSFSFRSNSSKLGQGDRCYCTKTINNAVGLRDLSKCKSVFSIIYCSVLFMAIQYDILI